VAREGVARVLEEMLYTALRLDLEELFKILLAFLRLHIQPPTPNDPLDVALLHGMLPSVLTARVLKLIDKPTMLGYLVGGLVRESSGEMAAKLRHWGMEPVVAEAAS
jgi:uncharacterized protein (UPF0548 family)